jgi:hypothetical protein
MAAPARFPLLRVASLFRPAARLVLIALGLWRLTSLAVSAPLPSQAVPFTICKESTTWTRPTASQQAKIWSDARYSDHGAKAYEWTHQFLLVPPDSASIQYHARNEAGLWTEDTFSSRICDEAKYKHNDEWVEAWILLHRVNNIQADGNVYTIAVEPTAKGFQSIIFRRIAPKMSFRFVNVKGRMLDETRN